MKLSSLQTSNKHFTISAFDHRNSLIKLLQLDTSDDERVTQQMIEVKTLFMQVFSPLSSAVLTDPIYGKHTVQDKAPDCGLLMSLEESGYDADKSEIPKLLPDWGIAGVKGFQSAAKFLLYFNPNEKNAQAKIDMVQTLYVQSKDQAVPFLLEVVLYQLKGESEFEKNWHNLQLQVVETFTYHCDVLKMEYPGLYAESDEQAGVMCQAVSQASKAPWIILSRGMQYDRFVTSLEISMRSGASGFAVGRAVWQEIDQFALEKTGSWQATLDGLKHFLELTAVNRLEALINIVEK